MSLNIAQCLQQAIASLQACSDTASLDAEILLAHVLDQSRTYLRTWPERLLSTTQSERFAHLLQQRQAGQPVAYLTGCRDFWDMTLKVTSDTLIPRPDTELLVEQALHLLQPNQTYTVADLGTGSGAIALAIARERPFVQVFAIDATAATLAVAAENVTQYAPDNVQCILSHWCQALPDAACDVIVSNPPYIAADDPHLGQGDVRFEPIQALVSADNGLSDIALIAQQAQRCLKPNGWLLFEHGYEQGPSVCALLDGQGYVDVQTYADLAGQDRVTVARWIGEK